MRRWRRWMAAVFAGALIAGASLPAARAQPPADAKNPQEPTADEQQLDEADRLNAQIAELYQQGKYQEAIERAEKVVQIAKRVFGETHVNYGASLNNLALLYRATGDYPRAEPLYKKASEIYGTVLGETHPDYATSLNNLAILYEAMSDYARAEPLYKQSLEIRRKALGEAHPDYAASLNSLAVLYYSQGDYARAETLCKQALDIRRKVLGEGHRDYATSLNNLALLYNAMGDYARAEPLYRQALEIDRKTLGETHPGYATSLNNLAGLYKAMGDYGRAEPLYKQALEINRKALGETHPDYAGSVNNLAFLYRSMGDYARAERLYRQTAEIWKQALGETHPKYATSLHNLAALYVAQGDYARAEPLYKQALEIYTQAVGETHPEYAGSVNNLAVLYHSMGDDARAEPFALRAVRIARRNLELTSVVQSERQQLSMSRQLRGFLDNCLSVTAASTSSPAVVYDEVLAWKGIVSSRQQHIAQSRRAGDQRPEVARLYQELEETSRRFATLSRLSPAPAAQAAHRERLAKLSESIEQLEQNLARASADFRSELAQRRRRGAEVAGALPEGAALVDLLEYSHFQPPETRSGNGTWQQRYAAFILRREKPIVRLDLGEAEPIRLAVVAWRRKFVPDRGEQLVAEDLAHLPTDPAEVLQQLVWHKLAPHLESTTTLLISPDGALARFPWAALSIGAKQYLIEQMAVAVVPVPGMLPKMIAAREAYGEPSLLLVGDVDYGASVGAPADAAQARSAPRRRDGKLLDNWPELKNTGAEALAVRDSFQRRFPESTVTFLRRAQPTEQHVREDAPASRFLHLATHGYFAPPELRSALSATRLDAGDQEQPLVTRQDVAGFHPGLLSGIVLAGANGHLDPNQDDGILTALEVAKLDLGGVRLVTLSACQTGLGETAGGEGLLGLQRAFQSAGAKSVVASLWKVHDEATRRFMVDFYEALWNREVPAAEALRQAQLKMLRAARIDISRGAQGRGLKLLDDQPPDNQGRLPPYYWAAFVLSGSWQ